MGSMFDKIKCWWGLHDWAYVNRSNRHRVCKSCHIREELWNYTESKEKWEPVYKGQQFFDFDKEKEQRN
jgi:hypothetical protein